MMQAVSCVLLESIYFLIPWIIDFPDYDRSPLHGVHPGDWEVASSFSAVNDLSLQLKAQSESEDSAVGEGDSGDEPGELYPRLKTLFLLFLEVDLPIRTPSPEIGDSDDWEFGPSFSTIANIFTARAVSIV
jgi:hypothetical protein